MDHQDALTDFADLMTQPRGAFVNGVWDYGDGAALEDIDPSSERPLANVQMCSDDQADAAVLAAMGAQSAWADLTYAARAEYLWRLVPLLERDTESLARLVALEVGKPVTQARGELGFAIKLLKFMASSAHHVVGEIVPSDDADETIHLNRVPMGVVVAICAWNFPIAMYFRKLAPALLTGNTVLIKPSEIAPLCGIALTRLCEEAGLPPGVLNLVVGGREVGRALVANPNVDMVTMTGSVPSGRAVMREAVDHLPKVSLELGGKAPAIVWRDADLALAAEALVQARLQNTGQVCTCVERLYVHEDVRDEFMDHFVRIASKLRIGDPLEASTDLGPLASQAQQQKVRSILTDSLDAGAVASALISADQVEGKPGFWQVPTLLSNVSPDMRVMREEVFGPVLPVVTITSLDEAFSLANDSQQGLTSFIFSESYRVVMEANRRLKAGTLYVNRSHGSAVQAFHSGQRQSGIGGEDGMHGLLEYTQIHTTYFKL